MLDSRVRLIIDPALERVARTFVSLGLSADAVTIGGFVLGAAGCVAIGFQAYAVALVLLMLNRVADGLDGSIARQRGATDLGGFLDIVLDLIFYSGVPFAFAVSRPECTLPATFLIYSFIGTGGSFLAYATIAAKRGLKHNYHGSKAIYYTTGLIEGTETIIFFILCCLLPDRFPLLAWTFGGLCWVTTLARIIAGVIAFQQPK